MHVRLGIFDMWNACHSSGDVHAKWVKNFNFLICAHDELVGGG